MQLPLMILTMQLPLMILVKHLKLLEIVGFLLHHLVAVYLAVYLTFLYKVPLKSYRHSDHIVNRTRCGQLNQSSTITRRECLTQNY